MDIDESGNGQKQWKNGEQHVYRYHDEEERDSHQEQVLLFSKFDDKNFQTAADGTNENK
jgi:hypothetical protein